MVSDSYSMLINPIFIAAVFSITANLLRLMSRLSACGNAAPSLSRGPFFVVKFKSANEVEFTDTLLHVYRCMVNRKLSPTT